MSPVRIMSQLIRQTLKCKLKHELTIHNPTQTRLMSNGTSSEGEKRISDILLKRFPKANISVTDISGGCGAMYEIIVESNEFQGIRTVLQHRLVHEALKEEIKAAHGVRIVTSAPQK